MLQFHGCGGVRASQGEWATLFRDAGWAAVVVDSLTGRDLDARTVCSGRALLGAERAGDVWAALDDLAGLPFVDPERLVLAGWSHGAWAIMDLLAMDPPRELPPSLREAPATGLGGVRGLVLFYPYCGWGARAAVWRPRIPALFVLAGADSVASPGPCLDVAGALTDAGHAVTVQLYDGVDHAFDQPDLDAAGRLVYRPRITADARERVVDFLGGVAARGSGRGL